MKSDRTSEKTKAAERKEYTLTAAHTHRGEECKAGDKIMLTPAQAWFLRAKLATDKIVTAQPAVAEQEG